jgi:hypothetical protein
MSFKPRPSGKPLTRRPPAAVRRQLRTEVGFRCPVEDCGLPYLSWHHFDPPWRVEQHHRPEGMIALCRVHADAADANTFTPDQLRDLKRNGARNNEAIRHRFRWQRNRLLAVVGGNYLYNVQCPIATRGIPLLWFTRDAQQDLELNFWMPSRQSESRFRVLENDWVVPPGAADVECPPSGRRLTVVYADGDRFDVEFRESLDRADLGNYLELSDSDDRFDDVEYPVTTVQVTAKAQGTGLDLSPSKMTFGVGNVMSGMFATNGAGLLDFSLNHGFGPLTTRQELNWRDLIDDEWPLIVGRRFERCIFRGPARVWLVPHGAIITHSMADAGTCSLSPGPGGPRLPRQGGPIIIEACVFNECSFFETEFLGVTLEQWRGTQ